MASPNSDGKRGIFKAGMIFLLVAHLLTIISNMKPVIGSPSDYSDSSSVEIGGGSSFQRTKRQIGSSSDASYGTPPSYVLLAFQNYLRQVQAHQRAESSLAATRMEGVMGSGFGRLFSSSSRQKRQSGKENGEAGKEEEKEAEKDAQKDAEKDAEKDAGKETEKDAEKNAEKDAEKDDDGKETEKDTEKEGSDKNDENPEEEGDDEEEDSSVEIDFDDIKTWPQTYPLCDPQQNDHTSPVDISTANIAQVKGVQTLIAFSGQPRPEAYVLSTMFHSDDEVKLEGFSIRLRDEDVVHDATYVTGLGSDDNRYFDSALFFIRPENSSSSPSQLDSSRRGHTIDKVEYPMEVMINFKPHAGNQTTQIHVLVEIAEEENPVWRPILTMFIPLIENVIHEKCFGAETAEQLNENMESAFNEYRDELSKQQKELNGSAPTYNDRYNELKEMYELIKEANEQKMTRLNSSVEAAKDKSEQCRKEIPENKDKLIRLEEELLEKQEELKLAIIKYLEEGSTTIKPRTIKQKTNGSRKANLVATKEKDGGSTSTTSSATTSSTTTSSTANSSTTTSSTTATSSSTPKPLDSVDENDDGGDSQAKGNATNKGGSTLTTTSSTTTSSSATISTSTTLKPFDSIDANGGGDDSQAKVNATNQGGSTSSTTTSPTTSTTTPSRRKRDATNAENESADAKVDPKNGDKPSSSTSTTTTTTLSPNPKLDSTDEDGDAKTKGEVKNGDRSSSATSTTTTLSPKLKLDSTNETGDAKTKGEAKNGDGSSSATSTTTTMPPKSKLDSTHEDGDTKTKGEAKNGDGSSSSSTTTLSPKQKLNSTDENGDAKTKGEAKNGNESSTTTTKPKRSSKTLLELSMSLKSNLPTRDKERSHTQFQEIKKLEGVVQEKSFEIDMIKLQQAFNAKCITQQASSARVLQLQVDTLTRLREYYKIGSNPGDLFPSVEAVKEEGEKMKNSSINLKSLKEAYETAKLQTETMMVMQQRSIPLKDPFHISWLFPARGGHYFYNGSSPIPPCHRRAHVIVFEDKITISKNQWRQFHEFPATKQKGEGVWEKLCGDEFETMEQKLLYVDGMEKMTNQLPEIAPLGKRTVWFNLRNLQYKWDDGLHMLSRVRRVKKWKPS